MESGETGKTKNLCLPMDSYQGKLGLLGKPQQQTYVAYEFIIR